MTDPREPVVLDHIDNEVSKTVKTITLVLEDTTADSTRNIPRRSFELSSDTKIIIGRSSKTISKGLIPASNNGYFDSPVVSREHASITADLEKGIVRLTDEKSLHGTSVNGTRLEAGVPFTLSTGDMLRFGAHVARALDIFHPTECKVEIVHQQLAAPVFERARSYCAPESVYDTSDSDQSDDGYDSNSDEPLSKSADGESVVECDSPTQTGGIQIPEDKAAEVSKDVIDNQTQNSLIEAMLIDDDDEEDEEDEEDRASYEYDSDDGSSIENDAEMDEIDGDEADEDEEIEDDEYDEEYAEDEAEEEEGEREEQCGLEDEDTDEAMMYDEAVAEMRAVDNEVVALISGEIDPIAAEEDKDGAAFLEHKIRQFMEKAMREGKAMDQKLKDFKAKTVSNVSTPEPTSVATPAPATAAVDPPARENLAGPSDVMMFEPTSIPAPAVANKKLDISSILNPSSPSTKLSGIDCTTNESIETPPMTAFAASTTEAVVTPDDVYDIYKPSQYQHLVYDTEDLSAEATAWRMSFFENTSDISGPAYNVMPSPDAREAHVLCNMPAVPFVPSSVPTPTTSPKKRKMDEVAAEDAQIQVSMDAATTEAAAQTPTPEQPEPFKQSETPKAAQTQTICQGMLTPPPVDDGPAPKRQATSQSVAAKSQTKSKAWAAVEKIGIAALGGAVVLGSLIYTAPTF